MYSYICIEGEKELDDFCLKRFKEVPKFVETIGHLTGVTVYLRYKEKAGRWVSMYFLFMESDKEGSVSWSKLQEIMKQSYEQIKADRRAILKD